MVNIKSIMRKEDKIPAREKKYYWGGFRRIQAATENERSKHSRLYNFVNPQLTDQGVTYEIVLKKRLKRW